MPSRTLDTEVDRLYQLPLDEFTAARNALAKTAGKQSGHVRGLAKPPVTAWAVNQLYWRDRGTWDELIAAAENARRVNRAVLAGKSGDVRAANKVHEDAVEKAFKSTLSLLSAGGHPATDATRQAISTTLRALPGEDAPGRLTRPLQPGGFEALAGLPVGAGPGRNFRLKAEATRRGGEAAGRVAEAARREAEAAGRGKKVDAKALTRQRQAEAAAARTLKEAEAAARREEFEKARTERDAKRAAAAVEKAREGVERAKEELARAEGDAREAADASRAAAERARKAHEALARAKHGQA